MWKKTAIGALRQVVSIEVVMFHDEVVFFDCRPYKLHVAWYHIIFQVTGVPFFKSSFTFLPINIS